MAQITTSDVRDTIDHLTATPIIHVQVLLASFLVQAM
jgi:hypothetical protein